MVTGKEKLQEYYNLQATIYAENCGIVKYEVKGNKMVYYANYPATAFENRKTYKVCVNLDFFREESRKELKRYNKVGDYNLYK